MVAYSFKARFREPILAGTKCQTIRSPRKRHACAGEELQLYTGMRTKYCSLIRLARCVDVMPIRLELDAGRIESLQSGMALTMLPDLDAFAVSDGFAQWDDMVDFWRKEHPDLQVFEGVLIKWSPIVNRAQ